MVMRPRPRGFSLVEILVAVTVLCVGVLGAAAVAAQAGVRLREAEALEAGIAAGTRVLDSLVQHATVEAGTRRIDRFRVQWTVARDGGTARIDAVVAFHDGTRARRIALVTRHAPPPRRVEGVEP